MKEQECDPYKLPPDKDEIYEIFRRYNFQDECGHPLLLCAEFIQLVNSYCEKSPYKKGG